MDGAVLAPTATSTLADRWYPVGETRVDLLHLLEDLADAYPGDLEETVLTEMMANALDSGASVIEIRTDSTASALTVIDSGRGMSRAELRRFHDIAATTKTRGEGIGFAGVGIKLGLLVSSEVLSETRTARSHVATTWRLSGRHRAPWQWTQPAGFVSARGTSVRLTLQNALSPLLDSGFIESLVRRHFEPLLNFAFDELLSAHYPTGVRFLVNGQELARVQPLGANIAPISLRLGRRRKPSAVGFLVLQDGTLPEQRRGVAISTFGKVIKRGWDWLGVSPEAADRITGLIEAPALASCLTLNKVDFIRSGARGATYLAFRKAIQEAVSDQLTQWGDERGTEPQRRRAARPLERDLEAVLFALSDRFPLLSTLVEQRPGGKRKLRVARQSATPVPNGDLFAPVLAVEHQAHAESPAAEQPEIPPESHARPATVGEPPVPVKATGALAGRRPIRLGLRIQFESREGDLDLGRLVESTVWVNDAHPAYRRASASRSEGYHVALAVAMALAGVAVEATQAQAFVTEFLAHWGETHTQNGRGKRRRQRRS